MTKSLLQVRLEQFENAAKDLAEQLNCEWKSVKLTVELGEAECIVLGRERAASMVHTRLQDQLNFRIEATETNECRYIKGNTTISFQFE